MIKQTLSSPKDLYKKKSVILKCTLNFKHFCKSHVLVTPLNVKYVLKKHSLIPHTSLRDQIKDTTGSTDPFFLYTAQVQLQLGPTHAHLGRHTNRSQYLTRRKNIEIFFKSFIFPCIKRKMDLLSIHINWT